MQAMPLTVSTSRPALLSSRAINAMLELFLAFDGIIKLIRHPAAVEPTTSLGYAASLVAPIGALEIACLVLYLVPRTSVAGALLLTGYLGGAVATQVRAGAGSFSILFPVILGALMWVALLLRDPRLRAFLPLRRATP